MTDEKFTLPIYIDEDKEESEASGFDFLELEVEPVSDDRKRVGLSITQGGNEVFISLKQFEDLKRQWKYFLSLKRPIS